MATLFLVPPSSFKISLAHFWHYGLTLRITVNPGKIKLYETLKLLKLFPLAVFLSCHSIKLKKSYLRWRKFFLIVIVHKRFSEYVKNIHEHTHDGFPGIFFNVSIIRYLFELLFSELLLEYWLCLNATCLYFSEWARL